VHQAKGFNWGTVCGWLTVQRGMIFGYVEMPAHWNRFVESLTRTLNSQFPVVTSRSSILRIKLLLAMWVCLFVVADVVGCTNDSFAI